MEYTNKIPASPAGSYARLGTYNQGPGAGAMAPVPSETPSMSVVIVPVDGSLGYEALTHGPNAGVNGNYFNIDSAYPFYDKGCTTFTTRMCS